MNEIVLNKSGFIPSSEIAILREAKDLNKIIIAGLMLPKDTISRNGILYDWGSIIEHYRELIKKPMMYNHQIDTTMEPMGHFIDSVLLESRPSSGKWQEVWDKVTKQNDKETPGWYYEASLNPENTYSKSMIRGDLNKVSIQVMADKAIEETLDEKNYQRAFIGTILEGSGVPVPGFEQTTVEVLVAEAFKMKEKLIKKKRFGKFYVYDTEKDDFVFGSVAEYEVDDYIKSYSEEVNTDNADGAIQPTNKPDGTGPYGKGLGPGKGKADGTGLEEPDKKDEGLDKCPNCGSTNFLKLKSGQLQCNKCKRILVAESFSENNTEESKMSEEEKKPSPEEKAPVEEQAPAKETKPVEEKPVEEKPAEETPAAKAPEEKAEEKPKTEALKEQDAGSDEEETEKEPEATDEEPMQEEMGDMDKVAEILEKVVTDIAAIKSKIGLTEETVDSEEEIEEKTDGEEEEDKPVEEPTVSESFNPGKIVFESVEKSDKAFKKAVKDIF